MRHLGILILIRYLGDENTSGVTFLVLIKIFCSWSYINVSIPCKEHPNGLISLAYILTQDMILSRPTDYDRIWLAKWFGIHHNVHEKDVNLLKIRTETNSLIDFFDP